ncbi:MAG: sugar ABC transporter substrate-binding protein [Anaerolineae bacterium]
MRTRKWIIAIAAALMAFAVGPAMAQQPVKVTIFVGLGTGTSPTQVAAQRQLEQKFNSQHTDIQIEFLIVPYAEAGQRLITMITGGNAPQLVGPIGTSTIADYLDAWTDITSFIEAENFDTSDFYGPTLEINDFGFKNVGLPLGIYPSFIIYNADLFDAAGLDYPPASYEDMTWDINALTQTAMLLTLDANGNDATSPDFDPENVVQWGFDDSWIGTLGRMVFWGPENGGRVTTPDFRTAVVNSPEWQQGLQWYADAIWEHHFYPGRPTDIATYEAAGVGSPLDSGLVAMFHTHTWYLGELRDVLPDLPFRVGIAAVPLNQKGQRIARIHADNFVIPEAATNKEEAWYVMKWLSSAENIEEVCLIYGCIPARASVAVSYEARLREVFPMIDFDPIFAAIAFLDNPHHETWVPDRPRVNEVLERISEQVQQGNRDVQAILDAANAEVQQILDAYWARQGG